VHFGRIVVVLNAVSAAKLQLCSSSVRWTIIINGDCERRSGNDGAGWLDLLDLEFAMSG